MHFRLFCRDVRLKTLAVPLIILRMSAVVATISIIGDRFFSKYPISFPILTDPILYMTIFTILQITAIGSLLLLWKLLHQPSMRKLIFYSMHRIFEVLFMILTYSNIQNFEKDELVDLYTSPIVKAVTFIAINSLRAVEFIILWKIFILIRSGMSKKEYILTAEEVQQFLNGDDSPFCLEEKIYSKKPFNALFEMIKKNLKLDYENILGQGNHGVVVKGLYRTDDVAVKLYTTDDKEKFKIALNEVKLMMYLDKHGNILSLLKTYTKNIRWGELMIMTPLCHNGSLDTFLRKHKQHFSKSGQYENVVKDCLNEADLMKYSIETAKALEFLASQKIVHGDLATRNILVTQNNSIKVADFGLSHHLYNYQFYRKNSVDCELPWRWMAPESLSYLRFSSQSDVWSFGVTLWEIFSLGEIPYGNTTWDFAFVVELSAGFRLSKPLHCNNEIYQNVLINCWHTDENQRYSFSELLKILMKHVAPFPPIFETNK